MTNDYVTARTTMMYKGRTIEVQDFERRTEPDGSVKYHCRYKGKPFSGTNLKDLRNQLEEVLDHETGQLF